MPIDCEPAPRVTPQAWCPPRYPLAEHCPFPPPAAPVFGTFTEVLLRRRSHASGDIDLQRLGTILWYSCLLRRRGHGRAGLPWESRSAPSAGGLHAIRLLVIPADGGKPVGLYAPEPHGLELLQCDSSVVVAANAESLRLLTSAGAGTTLQLVGDASKHAACYENAESLLWRDAGALIATLALTATAMGAGAIPLGRIGTDLVRLSGLDAPWVGLGALYIGDGDDAECGDPS